MGNEKTMIKQTLAVLALTTTAALAGSPSVDDLVKGYKADRAIASELRQEAWEQRDFGTVIEEQNIINTFDKLIESVKPAPTKQIQNGTFDSNHF